jgi:ribonuclease Z
MLNKGKMVTKKTRHLLALFMMTSLMSLSCLNLQKAIVKRTLEKTPTDEWLHDKTKIRIILCGTGSPQVFAGRNQPCLLIAAGGKVFLFDAGENAMRAIEKCGVPLSEIGDVFITHWHSDHFSGLDGVINASWLNGRTDPLIVYGPEGVQEVVKGFAMAYRLDASYRAAHFVPNPELASARGYTIKIPGDAGSIVVYDKDGVRIEAFLVDHRPVKPALGYTLTYKNRKIFISGDTRICECYLGVMTNADVAIHDAVNVNMIRNAAEVMRSLGRSRQADNAEKILEYHGDTLELARYAHRAGVKHLVLTHLIPEPANWMVEKLFIRGMGEFYKGKLTMGRDGMIIEVQAE